MLDLPSKSRQLLSCLKKTVKGSLKTPCLYLGITAVFLFVLISIGSDSLLKSFANNDGFYLADISKIAEISKEADLFSGSLTTKQLSLESPQLILADKTTLLASTPPTTFSSQVLASLVAGYNNEATKRIITEYVVESGDTLSSLAEKFDISLKTILWANNLTEKSVIKPGNKLVIPPVSGVVHMIKSGDTISGLASTYKVKRDVIVEFNELADENDIFIGDILVIPGGTMPAKSSQSQSSTQAPTYNGKFVIPVSSPYVVTQWGHGYYDRTYGYTAIDFSHAGYACGKAIKAAAGGTVQRTGFDNIAGYYVRILHSGNVVTFYGHLSAIEVKAGETVSVGQTIGRMGNTGYTIGRTGCHLHFEVRGAANPFLK